MDRPSPFHYTDRYEARDEGPSAPMKIWYQSFVDPIQQGDYFRDLSQVLAATADPGVQYDVHGILPPDLELHRLTEFRCSAQVIRNAVSAEQEGYDAFAIGHFKDGGLYEPGPRWISRCWP